MSFGRAVPVSFRTAEKRRKMPKPAGKEALFFGTADKMHRRSDSKNAAVSAAPEDAEMLDHVRLGEKQALLPVP